MESYSVDVVLRFIGFGPPRFDACEIDLIKQQLGDEALAAGTPRSTPDGTPSRLSFSRIISTASAAALVAASAGFGGYYAYTTGSTHGPVIAGLSVVFALGLEAAKPFAFESVFTALRNFSPFRALAMAALGTVAVAYSLTAELSLMAASRADASAQRTQAADAANAAKGRYKAAKQELEALPITRPVAAIEAKIARLKATPRLAPCDDTTSKAFGRVSRKVCGEIATLTAEAATTARRVELQAALAAAEADVSAAPLATEADPAASALAVYLTALGVHVEAAALSKWLVLVPIFALEVGSAFAVLLVSGTPSRDHSKGVPRRDERRSHGVSEAAHKAAGEAIASDVAAFGTVPPLPALAAQQAVSEASSAALNDGGVTAGTVAPNDASRVSNDAGHGSATAPAGTLKEALVDYLKERGGSLRTGQRGLAKALGTSTSELNRTLHSLAAAGVIALSTAPHGTELRLVG